MTGVFKTQGPSHITAEVIISDQITQGATGWLYNYLILEPGTDPESIKEQINGMATELSAAFFNDTEYTLVPMTDVYFHATSKYQLSANGDIQSVYIFAAIGIMILVVAVINFVNLTSATLLKRTKEVGVRKVLGSARSQMTYRFLVESGLVILGAYVLAALLALNAVPFVNRSLGLELNFSDSSRTLLALMVLVFILVTTLATIFPAMYLNRLGLSKSLKVKRGKGGKNALILFQFAISTVLIIGTLLVKQQLSFLKNQDLGYGEDQILFVNMIDPNLMQKSSEYRKRFEGHPSILYTATSMGAPGDPGMMGNQNAWAEGMPTDETILLPLYAGDEHFVETYGLTITEGKGFSEGVSVSNGDGDGSGSTPVLVNETAVRQFGWDDPIGKRMKISGRPHFVVGVVEDFHFLSLQNQIGPLAIAFGENNYMIAVRMRRDGIRSAMEHIEEQWKTIDANKPLDAFFLEENFEKQYAHEQRLDSILNVLTGLALLISAIGTLGMMLLMTQERIKEIGIRKVLGASTGQIMLVLNKRVILLLVIANLVAWPVAYHFSNQWLNTFAYKVTPNLLFFFVAGVITLVVALAALGYHSLRAAGKNPVDTLRYE